MALSAIETEDLLRQLAPQVLGALVRRYGNFDIAEDAPTNDRLTATTPSSCCSCAATHPFRSPHRSR
jgi:predicted RNA polymerase sigma factor